MTTLFREIVAIHDMHRYEKGLHYGNKVRDFCNRTKAYGHKYIVILPEELNGGDSHLAWLQEKGLGPRKVIRIKGDDLIKGVKDDPDIKDLLKKSLVEFFSMSAKDKALVDELGLCMKMQVASCPPHLSGPINCKIQHRQMITDFGYHENFSIRMLPHLIVKNDLNSIRFAMQYLKKQILPEEADGFVVKVPNKASCDGQLWINDDLEKGTLENFVVRESQNKLVIVEVALPDAISCSISYYLHPGRGPEPIACTQQLVDLNRKTGRIIWNGNVIAHMAELPRLTVQDMSIMQLVTFPLAIKLYERGVRGHLTIDMLAPDIFLEINARPTFGGAYGYNVFEQIAFSPLWKYPSCVLQMMVVEPTHLNIKDFSILCERLNGLLFNWKPGTVIPYLVETLPGIFNIAAIGRTSAEAAEAVRLALRRIDDPS